jgi:hypothetical protein
LVEQSHDSDETVKFLVLREGTRWHRAVLLSYVIWRETWNNGEILLNPK